MKNAVKLCGWYGGDETHAKAAWTSTQIEGKTERIPGLLEMLADKGHGTPFERSLLHFQATVDQATHIHILKHRHFSVNGESARYKEYKEDKYYLPEDWNIGHQEVLDGTSIRLFAQYHYSIKAFEESLGRKRAKESSRYFLPMALQINLDFSCNFRAFVHFQDLRNSSDAQLEVREIAQEMLRLVKEETNDSFKHSLAAWSI